MWWCGEKNIFWLIEEREGGRREEKRREGREGRNRRKEEKEGREGTGRRRWRKGSEMRKGELMGIKMKENILTTVHHTHTVSR